jgi:hypothetical protein
MLFCLSALSSGVPVETDKHCVRHDRFHRLVQLQPSSEADYLRSAFRVRQSFAEAGSFSTENLVAVEFQRTRERPSGKFVSQPVKPPVRSAFEPIVAPVLESDSSAGGVPGYGILPN